MQARFNNYLFATFALDFVPIFVLVPPSLQPYKSRIEETRKRKRREMKKTHWKSGPSRGEAKFKVSTTILFKLYRILIKSVVLFLNQINKNTNSISLLG